MTYDQAVAALRAYFASGWGSLTPVAYDDQPFDIPNSQTWVRFNIRHVDGDQTTMGDPGNNRHRQLGVVTVQVFQPAGQASTDARDKAQAAIDLFIGKTVNGIHFSKTHPREIGPDKAGFYQINVIANFRYDRLA